MTTQPPTAGRPLSRAGYAIPLTTLLMLALSRLLFWTLGLLATLLLLA